MMTYAIEVKNYQKRLVKILNEYKGIASLVVLVCVQES